MLETLKKKKGKDYRELIKWLGEEYNPDEFDLETINQTLKDYRDIDIGLN